MKSSSLQKSNWQKETGHVTPLAWAIILGAALTLVTLFLLVQRVVIHEREAAFVTAQDLNSKIALSDEVRIRSMLASLDKVMLVMRREFVENPKFTREALLLRLDELQIDTELNPRISFADPSGEVLLSSAQSSSNQKLTLNLADRPYFLAQKNEQGDRLMVGAPVESRVTGKWVVPLTRRITHKDGTFGGVVVLSVDPSLFTDPFAQTSLGEDATRALLGLDGYTLLRLNGEKLSYGGDSRKSQLYNEIKRSRVGSYTGVASSDGIRRTVSYRVIDPYGIIILAGSSVKFIENSYRTKVLGYVVGAVLFGALIVVLAGLMLLGIVRQRKLSASQQQFSKLIELVPQLVSGLNKDHQIAWVNTRSTQFVGPSLEEQAAGLGWYEAAVHPDDHSRLKDFISSAFTNSQSTLSCEYRKRRFDGQYRWFSGQITKVSDIESGDISFLKTATDIHDRKMAEERSRVAHKLESIGQLTGGMAHDFNNLLAIIVGNLDLAKPQVTGAAASRQIDVALGAAQRGVGLVKSLLALASKQPLLPAIIDLGTLAERVSPLLKHAAGQRVNFELKLPSVGVQVEVDEAGLEAVLLNLTVNAKDAMPKGGDLTLSLGITGASASIVISDTGTGMPEAVLKRVTEPFFTTKERGHGTGLGLSMVAGFVKQSRGTLKIQSVEGKGTTIEILLPLVRATAPAAISLHPSDVETVPAPLTSHLSPPVNSPVMSKTDKYKILVVDDEPALAELVRAWAKAQGHTVVLASSADDALTLLQVRAFDVLLTDIMMPGSMDGIGLAENASGLYPAMKILLMSGYSKETATNRADVPWPLLVKPFGKDDFYEALEVAFGASDFMPIA